MNEYNIIRSAYNNRHFKYYSQFEAQDKFIANLFKFKTNGHFLDIGSGYSCSENNSFFFDKFLDWKGICIDYRSGEDNYYDRKKTKFYCADATTFDYVNAFKDNNMPNIIDYLSIDADSNTNATLKIIPFKDYTFSTITIEHDFYEEGENRRLEQRQVLTNLGFHLLCGNVCFTRENNQLPWEDWWVNPKSFDLEKLSFLQCDGQTADNINNRFNHEYSDNFLYRML